MYILLTVLIVIAAIVLVLLVLVQNSKGGGLASSFSSSNQIMGVSKTTSFLEKATWTLIAVIVVLSVLATTFATSDGGVENTSELSSRARAEQEQAPAQENAIPTLPDALPEAAPAE